MSTTGTPDFAGLLQRYRRRTGLTQEELAERAGLSRGSVSLLERGITLTPQKTTVSMLSEALSLLPDEAADLWAKARRAHHLGNDARHVTNKAVLNGNLPVPLTSLIGRDARTDSAAGDARTRDDTTAHADRSRRSGQDTSGPGVCRDCATRTAPGCRLCRTRSRTRARAGAPAIAQALGVLESDSTPLRELLIRALEINRSCSCWITSSRCYRPHGPCWIC